MASFCRRPLYALAKFVLLACGILAGTARSQISEGTPPFATLSSGGVDQINIANRNIVLTLPFGVPSFAFNFTGNSNAYVGQGGV